MEKLLFHWSHWCAWWHSLWQQKPFVFNDFTKCVKLFHYHVNSSLLILNVEIIPFYGENVYFISYCGKMQAIIQMVYLITSLAGYAVQED